MKLDCVFYYVTDLDRAVEFYSTVLGLAPESRDAVARFRVDGLLLELVPTTDASLLAGSGNARVVFAVPDVAAAAAELERQGVKVGPLRRVTHGRLAAFADPDGNELLLWQYGR